MKTSTYIAILSLIPVAIGFIWALCYWLPRGWACYGHWRLKRAMKANQRMIDALGLVSPKWRAR